MPHPLRVCPHCGASISGNTERCPRCDGLLNASTVPDEIFVDPHEEETYLLSGQETTPKEGPVPQPVDSEADASEQPGGDFENAHTAPLPLADSYPRPAQPVPEPEPLPPRDTQPSLMLAPIPPAPFSPPPSMATNPATYWFQQRLDAYLIGGYALIQQRPNEAVLNYGKPLGVFWWTLGSMSIVGVLWYLLLLLFSGRDTVYIYLEPDGLVYEEGDGAAHVRRRRSRLARRWGVMGMLLTVVSVFTLCLVVLAASVLIDRYEPELGEAYPEFGVFETPSEAPDPTQVQNIRVVVLALMILLALSGIGVVGGLLITVISYLQSAAYRVDVAPMPTRP